MFFRELRWLVLWLGLVASAPGAATGPTPEFHVDRTAVPPGDSVLLRWKPVTGTVAGTKWIGLYRLNTPLASDKSPLWSGTIDEKRSNIRVPMPVDPGMYQLRISVIQGATPIATTRPIEVRTIAADPPAIEVGEDFKVSWVAPLNHKRSDWIALFPAGGLANVKHPLWKHEVGPAPAGAATLKAPTRPGIYEFRYFRGSSFGEVKALRSSSLPVLMCPEAKGFTRSRIKHIVVLVQENHSFDSYFAHYCKAKPGTLPSCNQGPSCCEAGPDTDPGSPAKPIELTEAEHQGFDPNHQSECETVEMNGGRMDRYATSSCGGPHTFAYAPQSVVDGYWKLASSFAMGDRVFQSVVGASEANDMYLAEARYVFKDNELSPLSKSGHCSGVPQTRFRHATIADVLGVCKVGMAFYAEGYRAATSVSPRCLGLWPKFFDPSDVPFSFYPSTADNPKTIRDLDDFYQAIQSKTLPEVSFVKPLGFRTEHPGNGNKIKDGIDFVTDTFQRISQSPLYSQDTLVIVTPDESGGYFDHVAPPAESPVDHRAYGPRVFLIAMGKFARRNYISHTLMEHSSLLRFIEWNWLPGEPGQLGARDAVVNGIGGLLDSQVTGTPVP